jgi:hypothetical protein
MNEFELYLKSFEIFESIYTTSVTVARAHMSLPSLSPISPIADTVPASTAFAPQPVVGFPPPSQCRQDTTHPSSVWPPLSQSPPLHYAAAAGFKKALVTTAPPFTLSLTYVITSKTNRIVASPSMP